MNILTVKLYRCDICGTTGPWVKGWSARVFLIDRKKFWEHEFHTCSGACDAKLILMSKGDRKAMATNANK